MRYFLAVAQNENVNQAAERVGVSPGSLSKAVARLEDELKTPLFFRSGRTIKLTPEGHLLKRRVAQILQLEEDTRLELKGKDAGEINVYISSEEILQTAFGIAIAKKLLTLYPRAKTQFLLRPDQKAVDQVMEGEAHMALITMDPPSELCSKVMAQVEFRTCASKSHPLVTKYGGKSIPVEELLQHPFVSPDQAILGKIMRSSSIDGWRDDKFPRQIKYRVFGLKLMENLIQEGMALGYLPDYFVKSSGLMPLKVSGCPYTCQQTVRLVTKDPKALGWLNRVWDAL